MVSHLLRWSSIWHLNDSYWDVYILCKKNKFLYTPYNKSLEAISFVPIFFILSISICLTYTTFYNLQLPFTLQFVSLSSVISFLFVLLTLATVLIMPHSFLPHLSSTTPSLTHLLLPTYHIISHSIFSCPPLLSTCLSLSHSLPSPLSISLSSSLFLSNTPITFVPTHFQIPLSFTHFSYLTHSLHHHSVTFSIHSFTFQ